jgi:cobalt-zinc-cadmium efflux system outer membrane protein
MSTLRAAIAAVVVASAAAWQPVQAAAPVRLEDAFQRVIDAHPEIAVFEYTRAGLAAERGIAAQKPALRVGAEAENVLGTGDLTGVRGAELTFTLASVLERGGKHAASIAVADRRLGTIALRREATRLDLLAEVARRYLDAASAAALESIATDHLAQRERAYQAAERRVSAGAAPETVRLSADAARVRAAGELQRAVLAQAVAKRRLSVLWGAADAGIGIEMLPLDAPPAVPAYADVVPRLADAPEIRSLATEARLREARVQLAKSARTPDLGRSGCGDYAPTTTGA